MSHFVIIAVMALSAWGAFIAMGEGMALERVRKFLSRFIKEPLAHAFYSCPRCMVSVWGTTCAALLGLLPLSWDLLLLPVYWLCAVAFQEYMDK